MKTRNAILLLLGLFGVGAVLYYYERQIRELQNLSYQIVSINIQNISSTVMELDFVLRITSTSTIDAQVTGLSVDVYVAGSKVGNISDTTPFIIPAKGYSDAPLTVQVSPSLLVGNAISLLSNLGTQNDLAINLVGYVSIKEAFLALSVPFTYATSLKQITS